MKKEQNYQLTMHLNTRTVLNENAVKFEAITAYPNLKANTDTSIDTEQELAYNQELLKHNSTAAKNFARKAAGEFFLDLASKVRAYAIVKGDITLQDKVKINVSVIRRSSDNTLVLIFETVLDCAGEILAGLADYGVTEQTLNSGAGLLETFKSEMQNLSLSKIEQKQITVQLEKQFKTTDALLKPIDAMVETMQQSDPVMYRLYWNARTIKKTASNKLSASGKVFDSVTNQPLPGAIMRIESAESTKSLASGPDLSKTVKIKSAGGGFQLRSLPTGTYLFKVTYAGYADQEATVYINEGVLTKVEMPLSKIA
jgi:hypothetical protein